MEFMEMLLGNATNLEKSLVGQELKVQLKEMELTFEKAKSDLAQDVQFIVRALAVNTSDMLKDKLRSSLKQRENQPTWLPAPFQIQMRTFQILDDQLLRDT